MESVQQVQNIIKNLRIFLAYKLIILIKVFNNTYLQHLAGQEEARTPGQGESRTPSQGQAEVRAPWEGGDEDT
jgi:hypothetical protein